MRAWWCLGFGCLAALCVSAPASAQDALSPPSDSVKTVRRWYGWQTLTLDGAALGVAVGGSAFVDRDVPIVAGLGTYALGAPIVHVAHGEPWRAAGSFGLRVGLPLLVGDIVARADSTRCPGRDEYEDFECQDQLGKMAAGALVSMLVASAVDAALLAYKTEPVREHARSMNFTPTLALSPAKERGFGAAVGLAGIF
jgi:hypothetical protein